MDQRPSLIKRRRKTFVALLIVLIVLAYLLNNAFPLQLNSDSQKPIILYYDYLNLPFDLKDFPKIVNFTLDHGFNTLMLVVYIDHKPVFNKTTILSFISYSNNHNLTFVPSYYIESLNDSIDVSELPWINLDMESLVLITQQLYYYKIASEVSQVSVTSPYGLNSIFTPRMNIIETYAGFSWFLLMQLTYPHYGTVCSIGVSHLTSKQEYLDEFNYCLHYSGGVMVFDYYNLLKSNF